MTKESWRDVGSKIRYLRKSNGLTLTQLANGCNLSSNTISLVERSKVAPSIETLCKIAHALGVTPSSLFLEVCKPDVELQRAHGTDASTDSISRCLPLFAAASRRSICELPGLAASPATTEPTTLRRLSILCMTGHLEFELDQHNYELGPGDSLSINSDAFHRWLNMSESTGIAVLVIPPSTVLESTEGDK